METVFSNDNKVKTQKCLHGCKLEKFFIKSNFIVVKKTNIFKRGYFDIYDNSIISKIT